MSKSYKQSAVKPAKVAMPGSVSRNLLPVKTAEAFVPTPAKPVRMRYQMGGGC